MLFVNAIVVMIIIINERLIIIQNTHTHTHQTYTYSHTHTYTHTDTYIHKQRTEAIHFKNIHSDTNTAYIGRFAHRVVFGY